MTPETRADMFRKGYVYDRRTKRLVPSPYGHEEHELFFDVDNYEKEKDMNRDFYARPRQAGGRTQSDYGRTVLSKPPEPDGGFVWIVLAATAVILFGLWLGGFAGGVV